MHRRPAADEVLVEVVAVRAAGSAAGCSGIVVRRGPASGLALGDEVFGTIPAADVASRFVVCRRGVVAPKPAALAHREAAVLAAVGPPALAALRRAGARPGDRVLITGAGDDTGAIAVQIARVRGHHVTAICRDRDVPLVWELGADDVLAREREVGDRARFVAVIDTDGSVTAELAARLLAPGGRMISARGEAPVVIAASELVALVERDRIFPVPR
jgi:NADPH:quinone reductase-like Zn-dependent oxidoreductase